jgi:hypothetical protein
MRLHFGLRLLVAGCIALAACTNPARFASWLGGKDTCAQPAGDEYALLTLDASPLVAYDSCGNKVGQYEHKFRHNAVPYLTSVFDVSADGQEVLISYLTQQAGPELGLYDSTGRLVLATIQTGPSAPEMRLSPDHRLLAASGTFEQRDPPPTYRPPVEGAWTGVFIRRPEEFGWRTVASAPVDPSHLLPISWAPTSDAVVTTLGTNVVEVWVNDGHRKVLAEGCCAKWSPDGKQIAYVDGKGELVLRDVSTGADRRPLPGQKVVGPCMEWSPDMRFLSLCFLPDHQPDPKNRYMSYIGVLDLEKGTSRRFGDWVWGYSPSFRWLRMRRGGVQPVFDLLDQLTASGRAGAERGR